MNETAPRVIKIPAKPESEWKTDSQRQLRVAAYCRVSTKEEDQANSYEAQKEYYTDKIMSNPAWTMAAIFADKGITGTSVKKREDFMRMIRHCRQKKIDVVLTKSVSRFARNTVDCLYYTRALKELGIAVIFEKENINSLEEDSELRITLSGAFAQSESESISANVTWGKRRAMESRKATIQYKYLYGYRRGADDKPEIIPEEAEVVRWIYERYLAGANTRMLRDELHEQGVTYSEKSLQWTLPHIKSILRNEKYCGDVLMQKTFQQDVINRKVIKNTGQLPMYLIENHHEGIVSREKYNAVQAEMARRKAAKSPSKRASTGLAAYTQPLRPLRPSGVWRVRNTVPPLHMDAPRWKARRVALCEPPGLRQEILPQLAHAGRGAAPTGDHSRPQHRPAGLGWPHPPNHGGVGGRGHPVPRQRHEPWRHRPQTGGAGDAVPKAAGKGGG